MNAKKVFSIVVPVYQNEANLNDTIPKLLELVKLLPKYSIELVFVDDGSCDSSFRILEHYFTVHPDIIRIIKLTKNFGQTPAIQAGLKHASGDCVGIISADLQEPSEAFVEMIREWESGAMYVAGIRQHREEGLLHKMMSGIYWNLVRKFALPGFPSQGYDFCLLSRQVVNDINNINEKNSSIFVLIYWLGYKPVFIPIKRRIREKGRSQWSMWSKINFTVDTIIGFTYLPTRVISFMGFVMGIFSILYFGVMLFFWFSLKTSPSGWMSVVGLLSLASSGILFSLGIMSEYLLRILDEARKRPLYVIEKVLHNSH